MRTLRRTGDDLKWSAKLVSEYDEDDKHHKDAMALLVKDILELTGTRNYYLDHETLLKMYVMYVGYNPHVMKMVEQNIQTLYNKIKEKSMKTEEDEAFDELARKQGDWGSGFQTKRRMAADKQHWSDCAVHNAPAYPAGKCDCGVAQEQRPWVGLTDEEIKHIEETTTCLGNESWLRNLTRNLEAKLKEKNG
jgi:hypothetical protein